MNTSFPAIRHALSLSHWKGAFNPNRTDGLTVRDFNTGHGRQAACGDTVTLTLQGRTSKGEPFDPTRDETRPVTPSQLREKTIHPAEEQGLIGNARRRDATDHRYPPLRRSMTRRIRQKSSHRPPCGELRIDHPEIFKNPLAPLFAYKHSGHHRCTGRRCFMWHDDSGFDTNMGCGGCYTGCPDIHQNHLRKTRNGHGVWIRHLSESRSGTYIQLRHIISFITARCYRAEWQDHAAGGRYTHQRKLRTCCCGRRRATNPAIFSRAIAFIFERISPPCAWAISRAMESPSPIPPVSPSWRGFRRNGLILLLVHFPESCFGILNANTYRHGSGSILICACWP